jgi:DNA-binding phage protein
MHYQAIRAKLRKAHIPDVAKATGLPRSTLYRLLATDAIPLYRTILRLEKWAQR